MDWLIFQDMVAEKANALTPTVPTPSKPKPVTGFVKTERELLLLLIKVIKENLSCLVNQ